MIDIMTYRYVPGPQLQLSNLIFTPHTCSYSAATCAPVVHTGIRTERTLYIHMYTTMV